VRPAAKKISPASGRTMDASGVFLPCDVCASHIVTCSSMQVWDDETVRSYVKHLDTDCVNAHLRVQKKPKHHTGNGTYRGAFAFTITKGPNDALTVGDMLKAARKLMAQTSCPVVKYAWFYEDKGRDANGDPIHPHIHGMYETVTGGRIEAKHFKRAWSIWDESPKARLGSGFRGGYHAAVKSEESYKDYIKKDGGMGESSDNF